MNDKAFEKWWTEYGHGNDNGLLQARDAWMAAVADAEGPAAPVGRPEDARTVKPWTTMPCDSCGNDHLATRGEARTKRAFVCEGCEMYERGYTDGYDDRAPLPEGARRIVEAVTRFLEDEGVCLEDGEPYCAGACPYCDLARVVDECAPAVLAKVENDGS